MKIGNIEKVNIVLLYKDNTLNLTEIVDLR